MTLQHIDRVAAHHDVWARTYDDDYFAHFELYHQITLAHMKRWLPPPQAAPVLDAGGGTGIWTRELVRLGHHVTLVDVSEGMLSKARERLRAEGIGDRVEIVQADITDLSMWSDGRFAAVVCQGDPLSYCGDHETATAELARLTRPGGVVIASVDSRSNALLWLASPPDLDALERLLVTGDTELPNCEPRLRYCVHAFTPEELMRLFEENGLKTEAVIGKPVLANRLKNVAEMPDEELQRLLALELRWNGDPAFVAQGGHLEIVGRRV